MSSGNGSGWRRATTLSPLGTSGDITAMLDSAEVFARLAPKLPTATHDMLRFSSSLLAFALLVSDLSAQTYPTANLWPNGDAEAGPIAGATDGSWWGNEPYGTYAPTEVGAAIGGGTKHTRITNWVASGASSIARLSLSDIDLTPYAADIDQGALQLRLSAWFGGPSNGNVWQVFQGEFFDGSAASLFQINPSLTGGYDTTPAMTWPRRNLERTMLFCTQVYPVPPGTRTLDLSIFAARQFGVDNGYVDNVSAVLELNGDAPALPLGVNVLADDSFEGSSVVDPGASRAGEPVQGWRVYDFSSLPSFALGTYGDAYGIPVDIGASLGGGTQFVRLGRGLRQIVDLGPRSAEIAAGTLVAEVEGYLGGPAVANSSFGFLELRYFDELFAPITGAGVTVDGPNYFARNGEPGLVRRTARETVPQDARFVAVRVAAPSFPNGSVACDRVSLKLLDSPPPPSQPLGVNLLENPGFESGPTRLVTPTGWETLPFGPFTAQVVDYASTGIPVATQVAANGQQFLLQGNLAGSAALQRLPVEGLATTIDQGNLEIELSGWFGGFDASPDKVVLQAHYLSEAGGPVASLTDPLQSFDATEPVTAADRGSVTDLRFRQSSFIVPPGTRSIEIRASLVFEGPASNTGLADNLSVILTDIGQTIAYPGTGDDLVLRTGVNAAPSTGIGKDVKSATAGQVMVTAVESPSSSLAFSPLFYAAQVEPTGTPLAQFAGLPSIWLDILSPNTVIIFDPFVPALFSPVVLPGGTPFNAAVPAGFVGRSIYFQGFALSPASLNGLYAATDVHEFRIQ